MVVSLVNDRKLTFSGRGTGFVVCLFCSSHSSEQTLVLSLGAAKEHIQFVSRLLYLRNTQKPVLLLTVAKQHIQLKLLR